MLIFGLEKSRGDAQLVVATQCTSGQVVHAVFIRDQGIGFATRPAHSVGTVRGNDLQGLEFLLKSLLKFRDGRGKVGGSMCLDRGGNGLERRALLDGVGSSRHGWYICDTKTSEVFKKNVLSVEVERTRSE